MSSPAGLGVEGLAVSTGPTPDDVEKCDPLPEPPQPLPSVNMRRCLLQDQIDCQDDDARRHSDTSWILGGNKAAEGHYRTTHNDFFTPPAQCPESGSRRAKDLWHFLVYKMTQTVWDEIKKPPEIAPYVTEYREIFNDDSFTPQLEISLKEFGVLPNDLDSKHPLYKEPPCSFWYQKQMQPPRFRSFEKITPIHENIHPFRRNAMFSTPITETLVDLPNEAPHIKEPRTHAHTNNRILPPVQMPII